MLLQAEPEPSTNKPVTKRTVQIQHVPHVSASRKPPHKANLYLIMKRRKERSSSFLIFGVFKWYTRVFISFNFTQSNNKKDKRWKPPHSLLYRAASGQNNFKRLFCDAHLVWSQANRSFLQSLACCPAWGNTCGEFLCQGFVIQRKVDLNDFHKLLVIRREFV